MKKPLKPYSVRLPDDQLKAIEAKGINIGNLIKLIVKETSESNECPLCKHSLKKSIKP